MYLTRLQSACVKILMRKSFRLAYPSDKVLRDTIKKIACQLGVVIGRLQSLLGGDQVNLL